MNTEYFRNKLELILNNIERIESPAPSDTQDEGDAAQDLQEREATLELMSRHSNLRKEIVHSLNKINRGTYGICELSGEQIPEERLDFLPWVRYTREVQQDIEKRKIPQPKFEYLLEEEDEEEESE
jgi:RNA polymerase-binding transcription factor DksA